MKKIDKREKELKRMTKELLVQMIIDLEEEVERLEDNEYWNGLEMDEQL